MDAIQSPEEFSIDETFTLEAALIPAQMPYIKVIVVKKLVVGLYFQTVVPPTRYCQFLLGEGTKCFSL